MSISCSCECGARYSVREDRSGQRFRCKKCGAQIDVPELSDAAQAGHRAKSKSKTFPKTTKHPRKTPKTTRSRSTDIDEDYVESDVEEVDTADEWDSHDEDWDDYEPRKRRKSTHKRRDPGTKASRSNRSRKQAKKTKKGTKSGNKSRILLWLSGGVGLAALGQLRS